MSLTHLFKRAPRIRPDLPKGEIDIVAPSKAPTAPSSSLVTVLLPAGGTVIGLIIMFVASTGGNLGVSMLFSLPMMLATYSVAIINYTKQRKKYKKETEEREQKYQRYLSIIREDLEGIQAQQHSALRQIDPSPDECFNRVVDLDYRIWERATQDDDFLEVRLGLGTRPLLVNIKMPRIDPTQDPDPLIQEANKLGNTFIAVDQTPIKFTLAECSVGGIAGPRNRVLNQARAIALQISTHHSPDEVKIVAIFPQREALDWEWMRWLPHVWTEDRQRRMLASYKDAAHNLMASLYDLLQSRKRAIEFDRDNKVIPLPRLVLFLADPTLVEGEPVLPLLLQEGERLGAYPIFLADNPESLPKGCRAIAQVGPIASRLIRTDASGQTDFSPDVVKPKLADRFARAMAPIRLQRLATSADIPEVVTLLDILEVDRVESLDVMSRWRNSEPNKKIAVPIGRRAGGELMFLDLHARGHGPHGLGAGTTGSGKSELLQSLIAGLAVLYHPHEVNFVLIDYKGGGMSNAFEALPHLVGTITNLEESLAGRALRALKAEIERRQVLLAVAGENDINPYIVKYRKGEVKTPMPHLIIVADEFAELATQMPDFLKELVGVARVGRSLGIHLILTTQKPAGVVNEQIWANSRFRFCLRVERPEDSRDVLRRPDASNLTRPGQAFLQIGNNEIFEQFQASWAGAPYQPGGFAVRDPHEILEVVLDGSRQSLRLSPKPTRIEATFNQLEAVVTHIQQVAEREGITRLPGPWLPPLPEQLVLDEVRPSQGWDGKTWQAIGTWMEPVIGLLDEPEEQRQDPLRIPLGKEGHFAIYGAPGTGKTTLLQTLITSLALDHSPEELNIYILDFGARILTLFKDLPHVGGVVLSDDEERLKRLLTYLVRQMESRKDMFAQEGVGTLAAYRAATKENIPAIVVVLDNWPGFVNAHRDDEPTIAQLAREGGNMGIHLVLSAGSPTQIRMRVNQNITMAVALQLAERGDYSQAVGRTGGFEPAPIPGRGLEKGKPPKEFQTALPAPGDLEADRTQAIQSLSASMNQWKGSHAHPIPMPPDVVALSSLLPPAKKYTATDEKDLFEVPLGIELSELTPLAIDLASGPNFIITGTTQSGKTTLLQTWLLALAERFPPERLQLYLVDYQQEGLFPFQNLPHTKAYITNEDLMGEAVSEIELELRNRRQTRDKARQEADGSSIVRRQVFANFPAIVVAIDDYDVYDGQTQKGVKDRLEKLVRRSRTLGLNVLLAASVAQVVSPGLSSLLKALKEMPTGFILGTTDTSHMNAFSIKLPPEDRGKVLPPGEGIYSHRGKYRKVKAATALEGDVDIQEWLERIIKRKSSTKKKKSKK